MSTHVAPELLEEAKRLREALREIEQATEGVPEQNCMLANRIARVALRDTAPSDYERFKASSPENAALLDAEERVLAAEQRAAEAEAALGAYARLLVRAGVLRGNSGIGGQTMTGWACAVCRRDQVSPSTAHGVLCDGCRAEVIARAALPAPAEGFFARGEDGQYRLDPAPTAPTEERHWQDDADPSPGRAQAAYQAEQARVAEGTVGGVSTISPWRKS